MLILVVGPSGAGKDTLLAAAKRALADDPRFRFARRVITRPAEAGGEDHEAVSDAEFVRRDFALKWRAHGLHYGIPAEAIAKGSITVANVSRTVISEAARRFQVRVIEVTAPPDVLAARLGSRGREAEADVASRLARDVPLPADVMVERVLNDGSVEQGAARFIAALNRAAAGAV